MSTPATKFTRLAAFQLILSGSISAVITAFYGYEMLLAVSGITVAAGGFFLSSIGRNLFVKIIDIAIGSRFGKLIGFAPALLVAGFLFAYRPGMAVTLSLCPLLLAFWLMGLEFIWLACEKREAFAPNDKKSSNHAVAFMALLLALGLLLIPSRVPSLLSGIPVDGPFEFIVTAFFLPLAWIIGRSFFSRKPVILALLVMLVIKLTLFVFLPQSGFGVKAYRSEDASTALVSETGYNTWLHSTYIEIMQAPYTSIRELPVEWVNDRLGYDFEQFWLSVDVDGFIRLRDEGKFVLVVKGAKASGGQWIDPQTNEVDFIPVVSDHKELKSALYEELPSIKEFQIRSRALFTKFGEARFEPVLLYPDGSYKSLFGNADIWLSQDKSLSQEQTVLFGMIQNLLALIFVAGLFFSGAKGLMGLASQNRISEADVYLAVSAPIIYFIASLVEKPHVPFVLIAVLILITIIKIVDFNLHPTRPTIKSFLLFAGVLFLLGYFVLDVNNLRSIANFPDGQDGLEYQTFARNIFVHGDIFLVHTPPRAYKVLFPYIVGLLHSVFGQSSAAQFFMNAWCAVLSAALTFALAKHFKLSLQAALLAAMSFLIILCLPSSFIYYFRFGLIEPAAILCLMLTLFFAMKRRQLEMTLAAILTVLLRLDYLGLVLASFLLQADPMTGNFSSAWASLWSWVSRNLKPMFIFFLAVILPPLLIVASYFIFIPNYMLSASDVSQSSALSMLDGFMRVLFGGNINDFNEKISQGSFEFLLIVLPLAFGFGVSMLSVFHRLGIFATIDLKLALLIPSVLPAYIAVRPAAYFPRFSFPLLAIDILLTVLFLHGLLVKRQVISDK